MDFWIGLEWVSIAFQLIFLILIIVEKPIGWTFGIIGSLLSVFLFFHIKLYSESILYFFYTLFGVYGWITWSRKSSAIELPITEWPLIKHLQLIFLGIVLSFGLGFLFSKLTDAERTFHDAFSTIYGFIATYLEAHKIRSAFIYWIILNAFSTWLYYDRGLQFYGGLMILYFILSIIGLYNWNRKYQLLNAESVG